MKCIHVFLGADMRLGHDGLKALARASKIDFDALKQGEALVFINARKDRMKSISWNHVVSFVRSEDINRPIDLSVLDYLAQAFSAEGVMDYTEALKMALEEKLKSRRLLPEHVNSRTAKAILKKAQQIEKRGKVNE